MNHHSLRNCSLLACTAAALLSPAVSRAQTPAATAPAIASPTGSDENVEVKTLPEFRVDTSKDHGYLATETSSGTRMSEKLIDLPYSVSVVTSEFINDFKLFNIDQLDAFIPGITPADPSGAGNGGTKLRGFAVPYFRNGFATAQQPDAANVDRVEVLAGPASAIYGATAPGGILNFVTKKPETTQSASFEELAGSYGYRQSRGEVTGPVTNKLSYLVDVDYSDQNRPTDFWFNRVLDVSAVLLYKFDENTSLDIEGEYSKNVANPYAVFQTFVNPQGITAGYVEQIPQSLYPGLASRLQSFNQAGPYNRYERYNNSFYATFQHRFNEHISLQLNGTYSDRNYRADRTSGLGSWSLITNTWTAGKLPYHESIKYTAPGAQGDLAADYDIGPVKNQLHAGFDALGNTMEHKAWEMTNTTYLASYLPAGELAEWQKPDPFNLPLLVSLGTPPFSSTNGQWAPVTSSTTNLFTQEYGFFLNDFIKLFNDRLVLSGTARRDGESTKYEQPQSTNTHLKVQDSRNSYDTFSTGLSYKILNEALVAYINFGSSFNPTPTVDANTGQFYGNTTARGGETGLKGILFNDRLSYAVDIYKVRQDNQVVSNPANPGAANPLLPADSAGGAGEARGASFSTTGQLTTNLSLIGQMTWNSTRTVENVALPATVGQKVTNSSPARAAGVAAVYGFNSGWLNGLRAGPTYTYATELLEAYSSSATTINLYRPGYSIWGAMVEYNWTMGRVKAQVSTTITDLFNAKVITANGFAPVGTQFLFGVAFKY